MAHQQVWRLGGSEAGKLGGSEAGRHGSTKAGRLGGLRARMQQPIDYLKRQRGLHSCYEVKNEDPSVFRFHELTINRIFSEFPAWQRNFPD
jgi:hypothetical protein